MHTFIKVNIICMDTKKHKPSIFVRFVNGINHFIRSFKNFFKSKPTNNEYMPVETSAATGGSTIIDNSVKSVNQNNQNQNVGITTRNDDLSLFRTNDAYL